MELDRDAQSTDEYFVTALQIFDYCGAESTGVLRVDALMDKFAPFVKTDKDEYGFLKSLLDPEESNPEINATELATALSRYSESQKTKMDLEESFNLKIGPTPQDSDSGISTDGYQLLEELQSELKEKAHLTHQLRSQMDFADRQHEEALALLTAERDSLRVHLSLLREENMSLINVRRDYDEACDRLCGSEQALDEARHDLEAQKRRARLLHDQLAAAEAEKLTLQELLTKSKEECHRINEMYASRQSALLEQNEALRAERADLSVRLQDQEEFMQQMIKEKVLLEMELKDVLNKSNQTHLRLDRSIDVSYTEDQMLTALDSLNSDTRFAPEHQILEEEAFLKALKEDQGRATNMSLFDEIRLSFCNFSRHNMTENDQNETRCDSIDNLETSMITTATQTDEGFEETPQICLNCLKNKTLISICVQTDPEMLQNISHSPKSNIQIDDQYENGNTTNTEDSNLVVNNNDAIPCDDCPRCLECENKNKHAAKLESDLNHSRFTINELQRDLDKYEDNLVVLQRFLEDEKNRNNFLQTVVENLQSKLVILEAACSNQNARIESLTCEKFCAECQTDSDLASVSTQVDIACADCEKRNAVVPHRSIRRYLWEPLKCLFQVFAVVCFLCAVSALYGVSRRWRACDREAPSVPWRWLDAQDLMDLLLRIEYVADVPM